MNSIKTLDLESLDITIQLLKNVIFDKNCERMNKSGVIGYLGELIVFQKLRQENYQPELLGKQSRVDIIVNGFTIDVKTSRMKNDGFGIDVWGWALQRKDSTVKYNIAICLALDTELNVAGYYCIYGKYIDSFQSSHERLTSVISRFQKFPKAPDEMSSKKYREGYQLSKKLIREGKVIEIGPQGLLRPIIQNIEKL
jgi:hypothetical protein